LLVIFRPAVALNVAVVIPAGTVTDAGTVSRELLLVGITIVPPEGAARSRPTEQLAVPPGLRVPDAHESVERFGTAIVEDPGAETTNVLASGSAATTFERFTEVVVAEGASVICTYATTPAPRTFVFIPINKHVYWPGVPAAQYTDFPAEVADGPSVTSIEET
jgi:hypothetical protein